jgi:hypothetical protein
MGSDADSRVGTRLGPAASALSGRARDRWSVYPDPLGSREGWSLVWVWSTLLTLHQQNRRHRNLAAATEALTSLRQRVLSARARLRGAARIDLAVEEILERYHMRRYLKVKRTVRQEHTFKQARRGRPGADTAYRRITRRRYDLEWTVDATAIAYDEKSDGMYPLLSNERKLTPAQVLEAHKGQPAIEKRFEQIKTVHEIAPVFLKNPNRIEALFTLYFLALLVQALIERELRLAMKRERLKELPLYPEQRSCKRPTTEQILRLFSLAERHTLIRHDRIAQVFPAELTELQCQVLGLLGVPEHAFRGCCSPRGAVVRLICTPIRHFTFGTRVGPQCWLDNVWSRGRRPCPRKDQKLMRVIRRKSSRTVAIRRIVRKCF